MHHKKMDLMEFPLLTDTYFPSDSNYGTFLNKIISKPAREKVRSTDLYIRIYIIQKSSLSNVFFKYCF